ncbi:HAMP domain-containing protein [Streptomyces sp. WMMB 322]|uniref:hybrid sensor histidine kinase/response regulator n=1 Tax=Streptomyces sp. WMMB 322 TaxID=1286821 RepID=UPI000823F594|nr:HAMP domain-containing protein [Streptomyces sp. WMMB 322]SCK45604.1 GAF sensor hybrid histidine kinase [Streptomyces sp. WMMB 322]
MDDPQGQPIREADLRHLLGAMRSLNDGDFSARAAPESEGVLGEVAGVFNQIVTRNEHLATELRRVRRAVAKEGHLDERVSASPGPGSWATNVDETNQLIEALGTPVTKATRVLEAIADGDLTQHMERHNGRHGDLGRLDSGLNRLVDQLSMFTGEVTRVAREVGTEGNLGGRADVGDLSGDWRRVTEAINDMAERLTGQVRDIAGVTTAVARGDLTQKVMVETSGELLELKLTVNTMVDQLSAFADEVTRVAREVGTEGNLGGQAEVRGLSGVWRGLTDNVNLMASNLTSQVRNIAQVSTAVAQGDLSQKITVDAKGEILQLMSTVNTTVDQLSAFADEVTRVAREVGTEGNLGGQAEVRGVSGVWRGLTDNVNLMASNLTSQVRSIAQVATAVAQGDLSQKITVDAKGEILQLKTTLNTMVDQLSDFADEVTRVAREVGTEGNLGRQAQVRDVSGVWKDLTDSVNSMALNLTSQVRSIAQVTTAVANGDLSKKIDVDARGEILELKDTVNTMVHQLRAFSDEVTRVAREVGTEGNLGGRAQVHGVSGVWKDLTDNVNFMTTNLTSQVRNIAQVATAVANGDLSKKIDVDARGEFLELKTTLNTMVDTLSSFSSEVTRVAREVGSEGQLGGQARVEGVYGTWKGLTTSVNELALNLTTQVRAIAEVASAVTQGDMSRSIQVDARGEVAELKDNVNVMVANLRETTRTKDWLESNLTRIAGLMQGQRDLVEVADLILRELTPLVNAQAGAFFLVGSGGKPGEELEYIAGYGTSGREDPGGPDSPLRGLISQAVAEKKRILIEDAPPDYVRVESGLGSAPAANILILPILFEDRALGVIEVASFSKFNEIYLTFIDQFVHTIGVSINTILANARTEVLLSESQRLTKELRQRSDELQRTNAELEDKAALLATSSQYKSEFLANMSHELRTPLNSLLILARLLADNPDGRLSDQEVDFATTIYRSGSDLLQLINDILDLSKVEAGRMDVRPRSLPLTKLLDYVHATFRPMTIDRGLAFEIAVGENVPRELYSDEQRIQQVLRNLLSNAVKFTSSGGIELRVERATDMEFDEATLRDAESVLAFSVKDTGSGIPPEKLSVIFEAFQQSDGTTSRRYGGTGLGLSISREIAGLLGGRIDVESQEGVGSRFTLFIPSVYPGSAPMAPPERVTAPEGLGSREFEGGTAVASAPPPAALPEPEPLGPAGGATAAEPETAQPTRPAEPERPGRAEPARPREAGEAPAPPTPAAWPEPTEPASESPRVETVGPERPSATEPRTADKGHEETWPETTQLKQWLGGERGQVLAGTNVLIVDDDIRNVFALTHVLGRVGISVKYAENGREGLDVLDRSPEVSVVLMDIMMPEMNGYEAIQRIRHTPRLAGLPVIALTAKAMSGDSKKALDAGADLYVAKPVDLDELLQSIYDLLKQGHGTRPPGGGETAPAAPPRAAPGTAPDPDGSGPAHESPEESTDRAAEPNGTSPDGTGARERHIGSRGDGTGTEPRGG